MKRLLLAFFLLGISIFFSLQVLQQTHSFVGRSFPGHLTFQNGIVGLYYLPHWKSTSSPLTFFNEQSPSSNLSQTFSSFDYWLIAVVPVVSGLLFFLLGMLVSFYLPDVKAGMVLLFFHFFAGNYLILSPDFHLTFQYCHFLLLFWILIAPTMIHFSLLFPINRLNRRQIGMIWVYLFFVLLALPYFYFFTISPQKWLIMQDVAVALVAFAYLFWLGLLLYTFKKNHTETDQIIAKYVLIGQMTFLIPLLAGIAIFLAKISVPLNFVAPLNLLFPLSVLVGVLLGRLKMSQWQLIQVEKRATMGTLMSGLAHELNNPLTFVYSNIEWFKEMLQKPNPCVVEMNSALENMEEGATRALNLTRSFNLFSHPGSDKIEKMDINHILDHCLHLLEPKWKNRIKVVTEYAPLPVFKGYPQEMSQLFINLLANAFESFDGTGDRPIAPTVTVTTLIDEKQILVKIRDNGIGIPHEQLSRIFDPFFTTKPQGQGTGLGLSLCLEYAKKNRGHIEVKSHFGEGTEFVIHFSKN